MIEINREEQENLDSLIKRFRRQVSKHKIVQEVKSRAYYVPKSMADRLKRKKIRRGAKRTPTS
jgi:ribosomal protein S21